MRQLARLTLANIRSYVRDRSTVFWTLAFPLVFVVIFGAIFSGGGGKTPVGWVDLDGTPASQTVSRAPQLTAVFDLTMGTRDEMLAAMRGGNVRAVVVIPRGFGAAFAAAQAGSVPSAPLPLTLYTDPSQSQAAGTITGVIAAAVAGLNQAATGARPVVALDPQAIQSERITATAYLIPSILAMALMQLGLFGAIPLVEQRQNLILKRLAATPLRRWTFVLSNLLTRLLIAIVQAVIIIVVAGVAFGITVVGNWFVLVGFVLLGAITFISLGYVVASFASTEDAASQIVSVLQFPLMFLSGIFFALDQMPGWLRGVATVMPLTYLGDALRQVMVGGVPFASLTVDMAILAALTVLLFGVSARFFRWQ